MKYLGLDDVFLKKIGLDTAKEIVQQPIGQKVWEGINEERPLILDFLTPAFESCKRIIPTGAGTSLFIGLSLRRLFQQETGIVTESVPTTELVSHQSDYLHSIIPTLILSFCQVWAYS